MSILGPPLPPKPTWWSDARLYYTSIRTARRGDSVEVWSPPDDGEVTRSSPGTLRLQLEPTSRGMRIAFSVLGWVGPTKTLWGFAVDPECDHPELLATLAMLHRNWWWP